MSTLQESETGKETTEQVTTPFPWTMSIGSETMTVDPDFPKTADRSF